MRDTYIYTHALAHTLNFPLSHVLKDDKDIDTLED